MLRDPMGLRTGWADVAPRGFEDLKERDYTKDGPWFDFRSLPNFGNFSSGIENQGSGDFSGASHPSGTSYDDSSNSSSVHPSAEDASLSSYLMDGSVRAMLKKVTVNEGALNQIIQSLGGGEKGLKKLMGYIMSWVREHKGDEQFYSSQNLESLHSPPPVNATAAFEYGAPNIPSLGDGPLDDLHQFYQPCMKSRRLMGDDQSDAYRGRGTFADVRGSIIPGELQYPKLETSMGGCNTIGPVMLPEMLDVSVPSLGSGLFSFASGHEDLSRSLTATTRAARRNRIARQRQSVQLSRTPRTGTVPSACGLWSVAPPTLDLRSTGMFHSGAQVAPAVPARKAHNAGTLTFLLQKELRPSDVGNLGRIILPKKEAEMHLPILAFREGVLLHMEDFETGYCWNVRYRFWPNNKSRMYLLENTGGLVRALHLQEGDLLILYRNQQGKYVLRGKKVYSESSRGGAQGLQQKHVHSLARGFPEAWKTEEVLKERDLGVGLEARPCPKGIKGRAFGLEAEVDRSDHKVIKAEPTVLVGDDDPFFKEDVMHNIGFTFGPGLLQSLERFPSLNLDFPLDEIMAAINKDDNVDSAETEPLNLGSKVAVVPKTEPAE